MKTKKNIWDRFVPPRNIWDRFVPTRYAYDTFRDEPPRLTFIVGRKHKRSRAWVLFRCSGQCFETGTFESETAAQSWADRLTSRRPVQWVTSVMTVEP